MGNPLEVQHGGDHYKSMGMQPIEFSMSNRWDACAHSALKYLTRYNTKGNPILDLQKARHFVQLRRATLPLAIGNNGENFNWRVAITMDGYIRANQFEPDQAAALRALDDYVHMGTINDHYYDTAIHKIDMLITLTGQQLLGVVSPGD